MGKWLFVGLGNMGDTYADTRHNIGFDIVDYFVKEKNLIWIQNRLAYTATYPFRNKSLLFIKPTTYMNESGKAVKYYMEKEKIPITNILVFVDDLNLSLATLRLKLSGSAGGHNGLKSIENYLNTTDYARLRFGIGNTYKRGQQVDFVLGKWTNEERLLLVEKMPAVAAIIIPFVEHKESAIRQINALKNTAL